MNTNPPILRDSAASSSSAMPSGIPSAAEGTLRQLAALSASALSPSELLVRASLARRIHLDQLGKGGSR